ncbi:PulJ/GspJ family protein [Hydrogenimonas sp.]
MKRGFTLVEMLISIMLTAMVFTYIYATLDDVKKSHTRYKDSAKEVTKSQTIFSLLSKDLTQLRKPPEIVHGAGYDRLSLTTDNSLYAIARPWVHYYISANGRTLIRVEATRFIDFFGSNYIGDANGTYFFADKLAEGCSSFRVSERTERFDILLKCEKIAPIVMTLYKGNQ